MWSILLLFWGEDWKRYELGRGRIRDFWLSVCMLLLEVPVMCVFGVLLALILVVLICWLEGFGGVWKWSLILLVASRGENVRIELLGLFVGISCDFLQVLQPNYVVDPLSHTVNTNTVASRNAHHYVDSNPVSPNQKIPYNSWQQRTLNDTTTPDLSCHDWIIVATEESLFNLEKKRKKQLPKTVIVIKESSR